MDAIPEPSKNGKTHENIMPNPANNLNHGGEGGGMVLSRAAMRTIRKRVARFDPTDEEAREAVDWVMNTGRVAKSLKTKLAAAKTLALLVCADHRADANESNERRADVIEGVAVLREAMKDRAIREQMAKPIESLPSDK